MPWMMTVMEHWTKQKAWDNPVRQALENACRWESLHATPAQARPSVMLSQVNPRTNDAETGSTTIVMA
jgi:hypothetical protein